MATSGTMPIIADVGYVYFLSHKREESEVSFSMAVENEEL